MSVATTYQHTRNRTELLCTHLSIEDYVPQLVDYASPPKWHLAHTSWFFEEMILKTYLSGYTEFDPHFSFLFNSYYNNVGDRISRASRGSITRPEVEEVYLYRQYIDEHMRILLETPLSPELEKLIILGINHEQQHQELLLTDLKFALGHNPVYPALASDGNLVNDSNTEDGFISIAEGVYEVGYSGPDFHFDNEGARHKVYLHVFDIIYTIYRSRSL